MKTKQQPVKQQSTSEKVHQHHGLLKTARKFIQKTGKLSPRVFNTEYYKPYSKNIASFNTNNDCQKHVLNTTNTNPSSLTDSCGTVFKFITKESEEERGVFKIEKSFCDRTTTSTTTATTTRPLSVLPQQTLPALPIDDDDDTNNGSSSSSSSSSSEVFDFDESMSDRNASKNNTFDDDDMSSNVLIPPPPTHHQTQRMVVVPTPTIGYGNSAEISENGKRVLTKKQKIAIEAFGDPMSELKAVGITPYRVVIFSRTRDELVLGTTAWGDRTFVYYSRHRTSALRDVGCMFPKLNADVVAEFLIKNKEETEGCGAEWLAWSANVGMKAAEIEKNDVVFGVVAASADVLGVSSVTGDDVLSRYFISLYNGDDDRCGGISGSSSTPSVPTLLFAQSKAAELEFSAAADEDGGVFARANAIIPLIHSSTIKSSMCSKTEIERLNSSVRQAAHSIEIAHAEKALKYISESSHKHFEMIQSRILNMKLLIPECIRARQLEAASLLPHFTNDAEDRINELSRYSSKIEELIGSFWSEIQLELAAAERSANIAASDLFFETRTTMSSEKNTMDNFAKAIKWGFPPSLDTLNFGPTRFGESPIAPDQITADSLIGILPSYMTASLERVRASRRDS